MFFYYTCIPNIWIETSKNMGQCLLPSRLPIKVICTIYAYQEIDGFVGIISKMALVKCLCVCPLTVKINPHIACIWALRTKMTFSLGFKPPKSVWQHHECVNERLPESVYGGYLRAHAIYCDSLPCLEPEVSFRMLWYSKEERDRVTKGERLIDGMDGGKRGQTQQEYYSPLSFGSFLL